MVDIYSLISRAQKLREETRLDSVSPDRVGTLLEDTLKYINEYQLLASSPPLHKIYASVSAMQSDPAPKSDLTGEALKAGQLVVIVPESQNDATAGDVYRYDGPSGNTSAWTFVAKLGAVLADAELNASSTNPVQNKAVTEKLTELSAEINGNKKVAYELLLGESLSPSNSKKAYRLNTGDFQARYIDEDGCINAEVNLYLYDSTLTFISQHTLSKSFRALKAVSDVAYIAIYMPSGNILKNGTIEIEFEAEGLTDGIHVEIDKLTNTTQELLRGIFYPLKDHIIEGAYISHTGGFTESANFACTDFLPILPGISFSVKNFQAGNQYMAGLAFYDRNKTFISEVSTVTSAQVSDWTFEAETIPSNAAYVRISLPLNQKATPSSWDFIVPNSRVIMELNKSEKEDAVLFDSFRESATLNSGSSMALLPVHIGKNAVLTARFSLIESISVGVGYADSTTYKNRGYAALWVDIDATEVKQYRYYNEDYVLIDTKSHRLTLDTDVVVEIHYQLDSSTLRIYDGKGNIYTQELQPEGVGRPFVKNNGANAMNVDLSFFPQDIHKTIWLMGDSYISYVAESRWGYYFKQFGYINFLSNNQPGLSPESGVADLESLLSTGARPTYLLWLLGMNGNTIEKDGVINTYQKTQIDRVLELCANHGITPILATIPPCPERNKAGYNAYVKSLGVRYVDVAKAVGATDDGVWIEGMLSSDGVHPTALGSKAIASQILVDFPEITILF